MATITQTADEPTHLAPHDARRVRVMAGYFFASFWCIVFTGAVRKWMFPHNAALYLLQDVPIAFAYLYGLWSGLFSRSYLLLGIICLYMMLMLQGLAQIIIIPHNLFVALVGLHHYLFYWPMLLVFPLCLTEKFRRNFIRWNLWLSLPMGLLVLAQAVSPTNAFINRTSEGDAFGLPGVEVARVSGTFNFVVFFGLWLAIAFSCCLGEWLSHRDRRVFRNRLLLTACTVACTLSALISGSRQTIYFCAVALMGALIASFILGSSRAFGAILGLCLALPLIAGVTYLISPVEYDTVKDRLFGERGKQDQQQRIMAQFTGFLWEPKFSLIGAGVGMGVDASHVGDVNTYNYTYDLSEGDTSRNVMELGTPIGLVYLLFRFSFLLGMFFVAVKIVRSGSSPHVLPLSCMLFAQAWNADMTRAATMTSSQVMIGYAFILGVQIYPDQTSLEAPASEFHTRSV